MVKYKVKVQRHEKWSQGFTKTGMKLCCAIGVESNDHQAISVIEWEDEYYIANSNSEFSDHGIFLSKKHFPKNRGLTVDAANISVFNAPRPIKFHQSYTNKDNKVAGPINHDIEAPENGFLFKNDTVASCVVYAKIGGKPSPSPIYISNGGPLPPQTETLKPLTRCKVWYSPLHDTSDMVSSFSGRFLDIDLTGANSVMVEYNIEGNWVSQ
ncbi:hypothetical protein FALBO_12013 [Fusarium albosuccineum]|uniref:Uncharacterized protein n=1 Tax=Fusarium albosuccineum TaxID=1237068 RepID=A0A8H4L3Y6_9HYPO|nr:hypothetical protein FALBO_12013 [Fusarium albosuccineum]